MNKEEEKESNLVKSLRQQLHKSFMQISEMQNLFRLELEHTRQQCNQKERQMKRREEEIREKCQQIENSLRSKENFMVDIGDLDVSLDEIVYKREETLKDSGIYQIKQILEAEKTINAPTSQTTILKQLQSDIKKVIANPPQSLIQLFKISNDLFLENFSLKQQLSSLQHKQNTYKSKIIENQRIIQKLRRSEKNLQKNNEQLNELYVQEASQNSRVEEEIRQIRQQLSIKNNQILNLKQKIIKLSDLLKTPSKLDLSKLDFKDSFEQQQYRRPPASLRMSSNAVLFRPKVTTPSNLMSSNQSDNNSTLSSEQFSQKFFKKRGQKTFLKKSQMQRIK